MRKIIYIFTIMLITILLTGCGSSKSIIGTWQKQDSEEISYAFYKEGECEFIVSTVHLKCTYEEGDNHLIIILTDSNNITPYEYYIENNVLYLQDEFGDKTSYSRIKN